MKQWDVFISHASEDKESAARPLASALRQSGARVWLDDSELKLGDSLREKIDEGLANSRYGVVVLSPRFFEKKWTKAELDGLFARDVVLPVWLDVTADDLLRMSPMLAGKLAGQMKDGVDHVAHQIIEKLFSVGDAVRKQAGSARAFAEILAKGSVEEIREFLTQDRLILATALRLDANDYLREGVLLGGIRILATAKFQETTGGYYDWRLVFLGNPNDPLFYKDGTETEHLLELLRDAEGVRSWIGYNTQAARADLPGIKASFGTIVVCGRRPQPKSASAEHLANLNDFLLEMQVRTYDWMLDNVINSAE